MYPRTRILSDMCIHCGDTINTDVHTRHNKEISFLLKEISLISSNITSNTTRVKTGIKQHAKVEYCGARRRDTHITDPAQRYVYPLFFLLLLKEISSISSIRTTSNTTRFKTGIKQLKRWIIMVLAGGGEGIHVSLNQPEICVSPLYFLTFRVILC